MIKFLLWCILLILCWPLALLALVAYPIVWLLLIPFRIVGIAVGGVLELVGAIIFLPVRLVRAIPADLGFGAASGAGAREPSSLLLMGGFRLAASLPGPTPESTLASIGHR